METRDSLRIPAFTGYVSPDADGGASFSEEKGATDWRRGQKISWFGKLARTGSIDISVDLKLAGRVRVRLTAQPVGARKGALLNAEAKSSGVLKLGAVKVQPGYWRFTLEVLAGNSPSVTALIFSGDPIGGAKFNLKERRNAASVHLGFPTEKDAKIVGFYNEVTATEDPLHTYYMACGFSRGYFGMQVNSSTERRVIFSIWDAGAEGVDRAKVADGDRVKLLEKGEGVFAGDFGNEGTGGHSHLVYPWKKGQTYRFCVTAKPDETSTHTEYAGWFWFPETKKWGLIARFRAPKDGGYLKGLYSFSENFGGSVGDLTRRVEFGNQWIVLEGGNTCELSTARFTCDATGKAGDRIDFAAGPTREGKFFLQHGGFTDNGVKFGDTFVRPSTGKLPKDLPD